MKYRLRMLGLFLAVLVSVFGVSQILKPAKAEAFISPFYPEPGWSIPGDQRDYLNRCDERSPLQSPGFVRWISLEGQPLVQSTSVNYGTSSIRLQLNLASVVCASNSAVYETSYQFGPNITQGAGELWGKTTFINHTGFYGPGNYNVKGTYRQIAIPFNYSPPGGFTQSRDHTIQVDTRTINHFSTGAYLCVGNGGNAGSFYNFAPCTITTPTFVLRVDVRETLPIDNIEGRAQGTCDYITGWGFDPDVPRRSIPVHVFIDFPTGDPRAQAFEVIADRPRPDVNAVYPTTGNTPHGFSIDIRQFHNAGQSRRYYLYFVSYDEAGVDRGNRKLEIVDVPSCGTPFNLTPKGSVTLDDDEEPTSATFGNIGVNPSSRTVSGVTVSPRYEVRKRSGASFTLPPNPGPFTGVTVGTSGVTVVPTDIRGVSGLVAGDRVCLVVTLSPGQGSLNTSGGFIPGTTSDKTVDVDCEIVSDKPYAAFMGNDVYVGSQFSSLGCGAASTAEIKAFSKVSGGRILGSGAQLAAGAVATIDGFASGVNNGANQKQLTFANTGAGSGTYGGNFGQTRCVPNYYAQAPGAPSPAGAVSPPAGNGNHTQHVRPSGSYVQLNGASNIQGKVAIYVDGDVVINSNVQYATGGWTNPETVPSFYLVVRGNIYITKGVSQLDGVYVAQPRTDGTKGTIYTCAQSNATAYAAADVIPNCSSQLTVYGSFVSKQTKLLRTKGSMRDGRADYSGNAAEVFRFSPEAYVGTPAIPPLSTGTGGRVPSYTTLPPVL